MPRKPSRKILNCVQISHKQDDEDEPSQVSVTSHSSTSSQETLDVDQADQVSIQEPLTSRPTRAAKVKFLQQVPQEIVTDTHLDTVEKIKTEPSSQEYDQLCEVTASDSIADQMPNVNGDIVYEFDSIDGITSKDIKTEDNVLEEDYEVRRVLKMEIDVESEGIQQTTFEENNVMVDSIKVQNIIEDAMQELLEEQQREDIVDATSIDTTTENAGKLLNIRKYRAKLKAKKPNEKQKHLDSGSVEYYITEDDEVKNVKTKPSSEESELLCYNSATTRISDSLLAPRPTRAAKVKCLQLISEAVSYDSSSDENPVASHHRHQQHEGAEVHLHRLKGIQQCCPEYGDKDSSEQRDLSEEKLRQLAIKHVDALRVICHRINIRQVMSKYKIKESVEQDEQHLPKIIEYVRTQTVSEHHEKHELQDVSTRVANEQDLEEHHELILRERKRYSKNADTHPHTVETIKTEPSNQEYDQLCDVTASDSIADPKPNVNSENNTLCECDPLGGISGNEFNTEDNILEEEYESKEVIKMEIDIVSEGPQQTEPKEGKTSMVGVIKVVNINNIQKPLEKQRKTDIDNASNIVGTSKFAEKIIIKKIRPALQQCPKQTRQDISVLSQKPLEKQRKGDIDNTTNIVATSKSAEKIIIKKIRPALQQCPKQTQQDIPVLSQKPLEKQRKVDIDNTTNIVATSKSAEKIIIKKIRPALQQCPKQTQQDIPVLSQKPLEKQRKVDIDNTTNIVATSKSAEKIIIKKIRPALQQCPKQTQQDIPVLSQKPLEKQRKVDIDNTTNIVATSKSAEKIIIKKIRPVLQQCPKQTRQDIHVLSQKQRKGDIDNTTNIVATSKSAEKIIIKKIRPALQQCPKQTRQDVPILVDNRDVVVHDSRQNIVCQYVPTYWSRNYVKKGEQHLPKLREVVSTQIVSGHVDHNHQNTSKYTANENIKAHVQRQEIERQHCVIKVKGELSFGQRQRRNEKALQRYLKIIANESPEERKQRKETKRQKRLQREANESVEQRKQRLQRERQNKLKRKANESVEQREQRRQRQKQSFLKWMANESAEKREQRRQRRRQKILQRKANETVEQREQRLEKQRQYYLTKVKGQRSVKNLNPSGVHVLTDDI